MLPRICQLRIRADVLQILEPEVVFPSRRAPAITIPSNIPMSRAHRDDQMGRLELGRRHRKGGGVQQLEQFALLALFHRFGTLGFGQAFIKVDIFLLGNFTIAEEIAVFLLAERHGFRGALRTPLIASVARLSSLLRFLNFRVLLPRSQLCNWRIRPSISRCSWTTGLLDLQL